MEISADFRPPSDWDTVLLDSSHGSIFQSTLYARHALETGASSCRYVRFYVQSELVGQLLLIRQSPIPVSTPKLAFRAGVFMGLSPMGVYRWLYGPALVERKLKDEQVMEMAKEIARYCGLTPVVTSPLHPLQDYRSHMEHFHRAGFGIIPTYTVMVDLRNPVTQLWASLDKKSARKNVERARKRAVCVDFSQSEEDLRQFYCILKATRTRAGLPDYPWERIRALWKIFKPAGVLRLVTARHHGEIIAGLIITCFNGMINELQGANSSYNIENKLYANDLTKWFVIEQGAETGQSLYDLSGVSLRHDQKAVGILRFKSKWGGKTFTFPAVRRHVAHLDALRQLWQKLRHDKTISI